MCLRRQWVAAEHCDEKQQSTTFIKWCDDADDWGTDSVVEQNDNVTGKSEAIEICTSASAELENSDADNNVVIEPIVLPTTDVIHLLDSRKEIPLVSIICIFINYVVERLNFENFIVKGLYLNFSYVFWKEFIVLFVQ